MAAIEVRSWISKGTIKEYSEAATKLFEEIYDPASSLYQDYDIIQPLHCLAGFYDRGIFRDESREGILQWMMSNAKPLFGVCLVNKFSWLNVVVPEGSLKMADRNNEETKAFIAVLLDNVRTLSQKRYLHFLGVKHIDWLSIYVRDQSGIRRFFKQRNRM